MNPLTPYPLAPIGSFVGVILSVVPLASYIGFHSWNVGIWAYAFWIFTMNITNFVNTIVWRDNVNIVVPVWCDITTKFKSGAPVGITACTFVLSLHLFKITRIQSAVLVAKKSQRRRLLAIDLGITLGIPFLVMALWIIVQTFRFDIQEELGCQPIAYSYVTYIIFFAPQIVFCLGAAILTPLTLRKFLLHRKRLNEILSHHSHDGVNQSKYIRVMIITCLTLLLDLFFFVAFFVQVIVGARGGVENPFNHPYISWASVHDGTINIILQTPASAWSTQNWQIASVKWNEWIYVLFAIIFFASFGTTREARERYLTAVHYVLVTIGLKTVKSYENDGPKIISASNLRHVKRVKRGTFSFSSSLDGASIITEPTNLEENGVLGAHRLSVSVPGGSDNINASALEVASKEKIVVP